MCQTIPHGGSRKSIGQPFQIAFPMPDRFYLADMIAQPVDLSWILFVASRNHSKEIDFQVGQLDGLGFETQVKGEHRGIRSDILGSGPWRVTFFHSFPALTVSPANCLKGGAAGCRAALNSAGSPSRQRTRNEHTTFFPAGIFMVMRLL